MSIKPETMPTRQRASQRPNQYDKLIPLNQKTSSEVIFFHQAGTQPSKKFRVSTRTEERKKTKSFHSTSSTAHQQLTVPSASGHSVNYFQRGMDTRRSLPIMHESKMRSQGRGRPINTSNSVDFRDFKACQSKPMGLDRQVKGILKTKLNAFDVSLRVSPLPTDNEIAKSSKKQDLASKKGSHGKTVRWLDELEVKEDTETHFERRDVQQVSEEFFDTEIDTPLQFELGPMEDADLIIPSSKTTTPCYDTSNGTSKNSLLIDRFHWAISDGDYRMVESFLRLTSGKKAILDINGLHGGMSPLQRACKMGSVEVAELLVRNGAKVNPHNRVDMPIALAFRAKNTEMCAGLITVGAKLPKDILFEDILRLMISEGDDDALYSVLQTTVEHAGTTYDLDSMAEYIVLLREALNIRELKCAAVLISYGVDFKTCFFDIPLAFAAEHNSVSLAYELCVQGENFSSVTSMVYTKLMQLAEKEQDEESKTMFKKSVTKKARFQIWGSMRVNNKK